MRIRKYGIVLESLEEADLEMVRNWRNSDHVRLKILENKFLTGLNCEIQSINGYNITLTKSKNLSLSTEPIAQAQEA